MNRVLKGIEAETSIIIFSFDHKKVSFPLDREEISFNRLLCVKNK